MATSLNVKMLGEFTIACEGKVGLKDEGRTRKVWNLLAYLLANRNRTISTSELPELLCSDERSDDPTKAVKNLAYRLRVILNESGLPKEEYIVQSGGTYHWNNGIETKLDVEDFEETYKKARTEIDDSDKALEFYKEAIDLYGGIFLPGFIYEEWVCVQATRYKNMFIDAIKQAHELAKSVEDYEYLEKACERAITYDPYSEKAYLVYIDSLIKQDKQNEALSAYETITDRLYNEMGVNPSKELREIYRQIIKTIKSVETDIQVIKEGLNEPGDVDGAFCSEYEIFKDVYRFVARGVERSGSSIYIVLCTITDKNDNLPEQDYMTNGMMKLKEVICNALRKGDLFAQYSCTQYVIMLPNLTYENGLMVANRIEGIFKKQSISKYIKLHFKLQPLDPQGKVDMEKMAANATNKA